MTPTLVDGDAIHTLEGLKDVVALPLVSTQQLQHSYLHVRYDVQRP